MPFYINYIITISYSLLIFEVKILLKLVRCFMLRKLSLTRVIILQSFAEVNMSVFETHSCLSSEVIFCFWRRIKFIVLLQLTIKLLKMLLQCLTRLLCLLMWMIVSSIVALFYFGSLALSWRGEPRISVWFSWVVLWGGVRKLGMLIFFQGCKKWQKQLLVAGFEPKQNTHLLDNQSNFNCYFSFLLKLYMQVVHTLHMQSI